MSALAALLPDGRLHLQHGPIDCLCRVWGEATEVRAAYAQAATFFGSVLESLCAELPLLRRPLPAPFPDGAIAQAMHLACMPFAKDVITPMASVAGAVADAVLEAMVRGRSLSKAFVNNGGDIAFHLGPDASLRCGLVADLAGNLSGIGAPALDAIADHDHIERAARFRTLSLDGIFRLRADHPARGLATSGRACKGRGGRSFSCGIADSVSILARNAAQADAAATIVGNAVDLPGHPAIDRRPANAIDPASDLGSRLVTFDVGSLSRDAVAVALDAGQTMAQKLLRAGLIEGAVLALHGSVRVCHPVLEPA